MPQSDPSRTEQATPKRRKKSRNEGNVPKSQEASKTISVFAGLYGLYFWIFYIADRMQTLMKHFMLHATEFSVSIPNIVNLVTWLAKELAFMVMPILLFIAFCSYLTLRLQVGKLWTTKVFKPKLSKLNPIKGFKRLLFSVQTFIRLGKSILMAAIIGIAPYLVIKSEFHNFLPLYYSDALGISVYMLQTGYDMVVYALLPMLIIAIADIWYSRWDYNENLKMTKDEVKDERKQAEGDPQVKAQQRQKMMAVMQQRMLQDVPRADVVITNPTHIAVALRYDATEAPAPVVLAIGADHLAQKIREVALENQVPIRQNVPLARALYKSVEVGDMIPEELYKAVAGILSSLSKFRINQGR